MTPTEQHHADTIFMLEALELITRHRHVTDPDFMQWQDLHIRLCSHIEQLRQEPKQDAEEESESFAMGHGGGAATKPAPATEPEVCPACGGKPTCSDNTHISCDKCMIKTLYGVAYWNDFCRRIRDNQAKV